MTQSYKDMIRRRVEQRKFENSNIFHDPVEEELISATIETELSVRRRHKPVPREIKDAVDSVCFIAEHLKKDDKENSVILDSVIYILSKSKAKILHVSKLKYVDLYNILLFFSALLDKRGLEIRCHGAGPTVSVDIYDSVCSWDFWDYPPGSHPLR